MLVEGCHEELVSFSEALRFPCGRLEAVWETSEVLP